jgi:signal transduction histidine kinase
MKLVRKLTIALLAGFALVFAIQAWRSVSEFADAYEDDVTRDHHAMGRALAAAISAGVRDHGRDAALAMVAEANEREPTTTIRWVRLGVPPDDPDAPVLPEVLLLPAVEGRVLTRLERDAGAHGMVYTYAPVIVDDAVVGAVEISESLEGERRFIRSHLQREGVATGALFLLCAGVAWFVGVRFVGRPVEALIAQARRVGAGDLSERVALHQHDELALVAEEMNAMTGRLDDARRRLESETAARLAAIEQVRHADRLTTVGRLASGIAHELGTPLNVVSGRAEMIASGEISEEKEVRETASVIRQQSDRMVRILRQLLDFARRKAAERASTDLVSLARETLALVEPLADKRGVELRLDAQVAACPADVDAGQLQQVLTNLVMNGIQASSPGGTVEVRVSRRKLAPTDADGAERPCACIEVTDQGAGMPEDVRARIFDPFFTTKPVGEGTGLGLSVAYGIVSDHGGWIDVASEPGKGSTFTVWIPGAAGTA